MLLGCVPATASEVERYTGRRPGYADSVWRLEVGGRFLSSGGVVYPSGVPYPEELHSQTAIVCNEVWLYASGDGDVVGVYWWPGAIRRPIASVPRSDFEPEDIVDPRDAPERLSFPLSVPVGTQWEPALVACISRDEALVLCTTGAVPDPVNEMVLFEQGGVSLRMRNGSQQENISAFLVSHSPPFRRLNVAGRGGVGRDLGRSLGPQTWPWPAELRWWEDGITYELKGFEPLATLQTVGDGLRILSAT